MENADLAVKCIFKLSTGAVWIAGTSCLMYLHRDDPDKLKAIVTAVVIPTGGLVAGIMFKSVEFVVRVTELKALENIWTRYQSGQLRNDLEKMFMTDLDMKKIEDSKSVVFSVEISEEDYLSARDKLTKAMSRQSKSAIPLVLPNDCTWDAQTGKYNKKKGVERTTLEVIPQALDQLRDIKGPVCVVSIAGPCRMGKSYILSKAFDQEEVFPLGHLLDPETMGIWLWVVPQKFKDSTGRDFTVVLLDSEGVDAVYAMAKQADDHRIFTLCVLLSSILIYNSAGVPKRGDLESMDFISKLSRQVTLYGSEAREVQKEYNFFKVFPDFLWILRDVVLKMPPGCICLKEYLLSRVFCSEFEGKYEKAKKTAESILNFFPGFDAFSLPLPAYDPEVLVNLNDGKFASEINPSFSRKIQAFKQMLYSKLAPKKSINEGEFVTGEALAVMVQLYVEALNTPGTVPNVENAWDTFVHNKCTEVLAAAIAVYKQEMTSQLKDKIPCDDDVIRAAHEKAEKEGFNIFYSEMRHLQTATVEKNLEKLKKSINSVFQEWDEKNRSETTEQGNEILRKLKDERSTRIITRIENLFGTPGGESIAEDDIINEFEEIPNLYFKRARGTKEVKQQVLSSFRKELDKEIQRIISIFVVFQGYQNLRLSELELALEEATNVNKEQATLIEERDKKIQELEARLKREEK